MLVVNNEFIELNCIFVYQIQVYFIVILKITHHVKTIFYLVVYIIFAELIIFKKKLI